MKCEKINHRLAEGLPLDERERAHVAECAACKLLLETSFATDDTLDPSALKRYKQVLSANLTAVRPLASERRLTWLFVVLFVCFTLLAAISTGTSGLRTLKWWQAAPYLGTLLIGMLFGASALVQEMAPGARRYFNPRTLMIVECVSLFGIAALLFHSLNTRGFVEDGTGCLRLGCACSLASAVLFVAVLKDGFSVSPVRTGLLAGFLSGLAGVTVLALYCGLLTIPHIWVWHFGVLPLSMAVGAAVGFLIQNVSRLRNFNGNAAERG